MGDRIATHIIGLDELMEGGIPSKYIVLLCGHAGTMKSSVGFNILFHENKISKRKGMYLTLEQTREPLLRHMAKLHMPQEEAEDLVVIDLARVRKDLKADTSEEEMDWPTAIIRALKNYRDTFGCEILVFDSLAALYALTNFKNPRAELFHFFERLRDLNLTSFLISEMPSDRNVYGLYGVEDFLSDGIVHLKVDYSQGTANLYIGVVKMRETNHPRQYFPLIFEPSTGRFEIVTG